MRSSVVTTTSVVSVILAGSAAIAANLGILNVTDNGAVGELSAELAGVVSDAPPDVVFVDVDPSAAPVSADTPTAPAVQLSSSGTVGASVSQTPATPTQGEAPQAFAYAAGAAGVVNVDVVGSVITISSVTDSPGWMHSIGEETGSTISVVFTNGITTYDFTLSAADDGTLTPEVVERAPRPTGHDDDDDDHDEDEDEHEDEHDEHDDHDEDEHDEEDEYEGGEDDD